MTEPESFGRYSVKERLGRGAMGVVYLAEDPVIGREVAIKVVQMPPGANDREREEMQARFEREFRSAGTLSHPNIVTIHDVGQEDDHSFIAMEFIRGRSLQDIVHSKEILSFKDISDIVFQMCSALDYAHERGVIHRDIKPANILMTRDGQAKLTDFGVAKLATGTLTRTGTIIGTPAYMSPEQVQGHTATPASDQFSVAIVLYEMLTGELPFSGDSPTTIMYKIVHEDPINPHQLNRSLPERIDRILMQALDKAPESRFESCTEFAEAVREGLGAAPMTTTVAYQPPSERPERPAAGTPPPRRKRPRVRGQAGTVRAETTSTGSRVIWLGAAAIIAALVLGFVGWQVWQPSWPGGAGSESKDLTAAAGAAGDTAVADVDTSAPGAAGEEGGESDASSGESDASGDPGNPADSAGQEDAATPGDASEDTTPSTGGATPTDPGIGGATAGEEPDPPATPRSLEFTIRSEPPGATVTLDGRQLDDTTPASVTLQEGQTYRLGVSMDGYESEGLAPFTLDDLADRQIQSRELSFSLTSNAPPGQVVVDAGFPVEVSVRGGSIDGSRSFQAGERHEIELPAGEYDVTLSAPSVYYRQERRVEVGAGEQEAVPVPPVYTVQVIALPPGSICTVYIDDREAGTAPLPSLSIIEGSHRFRFEWSSPQEATKTETVRIVRQGQRITASRPSGEVSR